MKKLLIIFMAMIVGSVSSNPLSAEEIAIVGTGDGVAVLEAVAEAFNRSHPGIRMVVPHSIGSGGGIKSVGNNMNIIGRVARKIKEKEKSYNLVYIPFARIPTVFFVHPSVNIKELTSGQVCDIFSGKITNWGDLGGKNKKIKIVRREEGDSSLTVLRKTFPGFKSITITQASKTTYSTPEAVSFIQNKADTIGFGPYDVAKTADLTVLTIDGKKATDPGYPSTVTLGLVFKEKNRTGVIKEFVDFATSSAAHDLIREAGGMPY